MSKKRQSRPQRDDGLLVRTFAITHPGRRRGLDLPERSIEWDQLAYASRGVMSVRTAQGTWVVPPHRAVWIPAGIAHKVELPARSRSGRSSSRAAWPGPSRAAARPSTCPRSCAS